MYKLLIVEDDPIISKMVETVFENRSFQIIGVAKTVRQAMEFIDKQKPDICLLDIQLKGEEEGTLIGNYLDNLQLPYLYLTAQTDPETLLKVQKTKPLGYIVKPFTQASLWSTFSVVWHQYLAKQETIFTIRVDGYLHKIPEENILYLEAFDNYCYLYTSEKKLLIPRTLKWIKEQLKATHYYTPHRSYYINLKKAETLGKKTITVAGTEIPLSEARRPQLLKILK